MTNTHPGRALTEFTIMCADRGQHPRRTLVTLAPRAPRTQGAWVGDQADLGSTWAGWEPLAEIDRGGGVVRARGCTVGHNGRPWRFRCLTCGRAPEISDTRLGRKVMGLIEHGVFTLDISLIG